MSQTRIEQLINEIYDFIDTCKPQPLSNSKIIVPRDQLLDLVDELKRRTPDEIKRYQKIIANRDSIINQAEERARQIEEEARARAAQILDETEIMIQARSQANELIRSARDESEALRTSTRQDAERIRTGVLSYSSYILNEIESLLTDSYHQAKEKSDALVFELKNKLEVIQENKKEIDEQINNPEGEETEESEYTEQDMEYNE